MTPTERSIRGRIGAYSLHAQGKTNTGPARAAFMAKFEREVDPEGVLPEAQRQRRAKAARTAFLTFVFINRHTSELQEINQIRLEKGTQPFENRLKFRQI